MPDKNNSVTLRWAIGIIIPFLIVVMGWNFRGDAQTNKEVNKKANRVEVKQDMEKVETRIVQRINKMELRQDKQNDRILEKLDIVLQNNKQ